MNGEKRVSPVDSNELVESGICRHHGPVLTYSLNGGPWRCTTCASYTNENTRRPRSEVRSSLEVVQEERRA